MARLRGPKVLDGGRGKGKTYEDDLGPGRGSLLHATHGWWVMKTAGAAGMPRPPPWNRGNV